MSVPNWLKGLEAGGDWADALMTAAELLGLGQKTRDKEGKLSFAVHHPNGSVVADLIEIGAKNIARWIGESTRDGFEIAPGRKIRDDRFIAILAEINPERRKVIYGKMDKMSRRDFSIWLLAIEKQLVQKVEAALEPIAPPRKVQRDFANMSAEWKRRQTQKKKPSNPVTKTLDWFGWY